MILAGNLHHFGLTFEQRYLETAINDRQKRRRKARTCFLFQYMGLYLFHDDLHRALMSPDTVCIDFDDSKMKICVYHWSLRDLALVPDVTRQQKLTREKPQATSRHYPPPLF